MTPVFYRIDSGKLVECEDSLASIRVYDNPTEPEIASLVQRFNLDEHSLVSALDPDEPSRFEMETDHRVFIIKYPKNYSARDKLTFKVSSMGLFLFQDKLIVVMGQTIPLFSNKVISTVGSAADVCLKIMLCAIRHYQEHLRVINMMSENLEARISQSMENRYLLSFFTLGKSLVFYLNAIQANGFVFEKLKNVGPRIGLNTSDMEFLDDLIIENNQSLRQAEIHSNVLASLMDARASIVSNNLNILMKNLTLVTISIMVPTLVVSIFSMNVPIPGQNHPHSFWAIATLAGLSAAGVLILWKSRRR